MEERAPRDASGRDRLLDERSRAAATLERIRAGDRRALARGITEVENGTAAGAMLVSEIAGAANPRDAAQGRDSAAAPARAMGHAEGARGHGRIVGITGPPGAGKSTLVNALVRELLARGQRIAVLAVDPSSPLTGGAVLGDRIRMADVHADPRVFVRSLAARGHLGGLTRTATDVVSLVAAAGFDVVIVETVGTGQSEVEVTRVAATTVVVCPPGLGDDVQALKAGVLEIANVLVVNKGDLPDADRTERELRAMLALRAAERRPPVIRTCATSGAGIASLADTVMDAVGAHARAAPEP
jgi:xanthine dehydrogenase accessory factor/LAO/AO transport system kinase